MLRQKKNIKFLIKSNRIISKEIMNALKEQLEKYKNGESEVIIFQDAISVVVLDEFNNYITTL